MQDIVVSMDDELKLSFEEVCADIGISIPSAILIFARRVARDRKIPFELTASPLLSDPFYSESNMAHLRRGIEDYNAGKFKQHDLIEAGDDE
ncbi:type II toxin-antitoxin system RelB/DinJ family antitoxin [Selenomonas noxia]|jgi:toxin-antitoxin system protein|uniref:type II toxin-antitoxin system RelB/DinJ family antitoxin n=1 Tax=Selenomonas noxia TaxID=135083 RepID=UPI002889C536|nr:type II toxin-antitoxin system RelB/DinJ family antitoxin [Selenomonas noxia]